MSGRATDTLAAREIKRHEYRTLFAQLEKTDVVVDWVPVAYQQASSVGRAATIMEAPDRVSALRANEIGYNTAQFNGGIEPMMKVSHSTAAQLHPTRG